MIRFVLLVMTLPVISFCKSKNIPNVSHVKDAYGGDQGSVLFWTIENRDRKRLICAGSCDQTPTPIDFKSENSPEEQLIELRRQCDRNLDFREIKKEHLDKSDQTAVILNILIRDDAQEKLLNLNTNWTNHVASFIALIS